MPKARPVTDAELRAAKLTRSPGVTLAEAAERFQIPVARVRAARRDHSDCSRSSPSGG